MNVLGVDLGGTTLRAAVADATGRLVGERTEPADDPDARYFAQRVRRLATELTDGEPDAIAVGLPGPVTAGGELGHVVNAPALSGAPIRELLQGEFDAPVVVENDVNLAALGESRRGRAVARNLVFIAVGTGVGMGVIADGRLLRGAHGGAGELGLMPLGPDEIAPDPDELGPLEAVAGGAGLAARWAAHTGRDSNGRDVFAAARDRDADALGLLDAQAEALAMAVRTVQALFDPELIVFGGGMGSRPDVFSRVRASLARRRLPMPPLERSALGQRAGLVGALEAAVDASSVTLDRTS